jgi:peptide/nickel transport system permease protein
VKVFAQRVSLSVVALVVGSVLIFAATAALPGDVAETVLGKAATKEAVAAFRRERNLDQPLPERYVRWIEGVGHGDLGTSLAQEQPVWKIIEPRLKNSLLLASFAILFTVPLSVLLGLLAGARSGGPFDGVISAIALIVVSLPEFVLGIVLAIVFGIYWQLLPPTSLFITGDSLLQHVREVILPALAAGGAAAGYILRMTRVATIEVLESDYIQAAKLRGVGSVRLIGWHILRNALIPTINVIGVNVAWMFGGLVVIETVFAFPGIGSLLVDATVTRDAPLVAGIALLITTGYILVNLLADVAVLVLNPRLRSAAAG